MSEQSLYNLTARTVELEVIPSLRHHGLGLIPWSPLMGGLLGGILKKMEGGHQPREGLAGRIEKLRPQLEKYEQLCAGLGENPADVATAWLLHQPAVTAAIVGPRTVEQLTSSLRALDLKLTEETLKALDEIWPGPGGEAPEAYAW